VPVASTVPGNMLVPVTARGRGMLSTKVLIEINFGYLRNRKIIKKKKNNVGLGRWLGGGFRRPYSGAARFE